MSILKVNNLQVGQDGTAANNYTLYQPASPDGTVRLGYGVAGSVTDILTLKNSRLGIGTDNPQAKLVVSDGSNGLELNPNSSNAVVSYNRSTSAYAPIGLQGSTVQLRIGGVGTALHVHSDGNVGIGTDNPNRLLQVYGESGGNGQVLISTAGAFSGTDTADLSFRVYANPSNGNAHNPQAQIQAVGTGSYDAALLFKTAVGGSDNNTPTERLRIASDGKLSLTGSTANMEYLRMGGNNDRGLRFTSSSGSSSVGVVHTINAPGDSGAQGAIVLQTNSAEKLRIDSAGNTTLGYAGTSLHFQNGFNNSTARIQNGGGSNSSELKFLVRNAGTESEKMRLTSTAGLAVVTAGSMPANAGNETLYVMGEGHTGHGTSNTRSVVSIIGALTSNSSAAGIWIGARTNDNTAVIGTRTASGNLAFETYSGGWGERMRIKSNGQVLIGNHATHGVVHGNLEVNGNDGINISNATRTGTNGAQWRLIPNSGGSNTGAATNLRLFEGAGGVEVVNITKAGHISVGTNEPPSSAEFTIRGANPELSLYATANYSSFLMMGDTNDYADGYIEYDNYSVSKGFKFITNNNHRMGLDSNGTLTVGASNYSFGSVGARISQVSDSHFCRANGNVIAIRRNGNDGQFIDFYRDGTHVGDIRVASGNVTLTGAHLSRWTQLPGGAERTEILRGSVLTNLDEMCEWSTEAQEAVLYTEEDELPRGVNVGDVKTPALEANTEDNDQLNRMKVSDVEGDPNVSGVFDAWDNDDKVHKNDFYCAMTGDLVIRIAQGVTVARGDLLMSAGDGTAKPQDDDIIRSKTIAKVTSNYVALTHPDGSYCVPCVLMAC